MIITDRPHWNFACDIYHSGSGVVDHGEVIPAMPKRIKTNALPVADCSIKADQRVKNQTRGARGRENFLRG